MKKKTKKRTGGYCVVAALLTIGLLTGCSTMRKISDTGRKVAQAIADNQKVVFDTIDGAIGVGEAIKTDVKDVFTKSTNTVATTSK